MTTLAQYIPTAVFWGTSSGFSYTLEFYASEAGYSIEPDLHFETPTDAKAHCDAFCNLNGFPKHKEDWENLK